MLSVFSFLGGAALYAHVPVGPVAVGAFVMPVAVFAGLSYAIAVFCTAFVTTLFLPGLRHLADAVALTRLTVGLVALAMPNVAEALIAAPVLSATIVVGGAGLLLAGLPILRAQGSTAAEGLGQALDWVDAPSLAGRTVRA